MPDRPRHPLPGVTLASPDDDGSAEPRLAAALAAGEMEAVIALLPQARLIVPVVATPSQGEAQMSVPALVNAAGRRALPVFTSVGALADWRSDARPVPMPGARVLAAAVAEGYDGVVLDVAADRPVTLDRSALERLTATRS